MPAITSAASGIIAVAVVWFGHVFTAEREERKARSDREVARRAFLRDRLELLVTQVDRVIDFANTHALYIASLGTHANAGIVAPDEDESNRDAFDRVTALAALYFPSLAPAVSQLSDGRLNSLKFACGEIEAIGTDVKAWAGSRQPDYGHRSAEALRGPITARSAIVAEARSILERDLHFSVSVRRRRVRRVIGRAATSSRPPAPQS